MDPNLIFGLVISGALLSLAAFGAGFYVRKRYAERLIRTAESKARDILVTAKRQAEADIQLGERQARSEVSKARAEFENESAQVRRDLDNREKMVQHREETLEKKNDEIEKRERESLFRLQEASQKEKNVQNREKMLDHLVSEERERLEKISSLNVEEAKRQLLSRMEIDVRADAGRMIREIENQTTEEVERKAQKILGMAMQRIAASYTIDSTVTVVSLPGEDMKGRLIGKDGRNIRAFETLTGVDLVIDDTPGAVVLSSFDGLRRETARRALEELIKDGRIQPARIEEIVQKTKKNMEAVVREEGEKAIAEAGITTVHPEIVKLLGKLRYRSSYGQNVLDHSLEVAHLMNGIAGELGLEPALARRVGLLHDLGKAVDHHAEGPHALIGGELARRYGEHPDVIHGIEAHHEDIEMHSIWPMLVQAADAVSAARPGARRESLENYVKRLSQLEEIADGYPGVEKSYVIQGGHEIRVMVKPDRVREDAMPALARELAKKIESTLEYPGQIKVLVVRETRAEETAK